MLFAGPVFVRATRKGTVLLGSGVRFNSTISENALCRGSMVLDTRLGGNIIIGENTGLSSAVLSSKSSIMIGCNVLIGANTQIYDHDFHALSPQDRKDPSGRDNIRTASVRIDDDCFIGANCVLLKGTHLGAGSIVAAGSVVFGLDVPPNSMVFGNPARIKERRKDER